VAWIVGLINAINLIDLPEQLDVVGNATVSGGACASG